MRYCGSFDSRSPAAMFTDTSKTVKRLGWGSLEAEFDSQDLDAKLTTHCSKIRGGEPCDLLPPTMGGSEHVLRIIQYHGGSKVVARLPLAYHMKNDRFAMTYEDRLRSEIATHRFLR